MRIALLQSATLLIFLGCNQDQNRFDVKTREFNQKSSHHYTQRFENKNSDAIESDASQLEDELDIPIETVQDIQDIAIEDSYNQKSFFSGFFNLFSSSDEKIDSLDQVINECEERLYTTTDASNSQQSAINSLIGERNYLLKQLDSLQTTIIQSNNSSKRLIELEREHQRLKSLINILSTEIE